MWLWPPLTEYCKGLTRCNVSPTNQKFGTMQSKAQCGAANGCRGGRIVTCTNYNLTTWLFLRFVSLKNIKVLSYSRAACTYRALLAKLWLRRCVFVWYVPGCTAPPENRFLTAITCAKHILLQDLSDQHQIKAPFIVCWPQLKCCSETTQNIFPNIPW